ncbi:MAG: hypothetical protein UY47_C0003G0048 [Parcubacteria group bacterium GW2011_GWB1_49_7]|nr:MAG: hypothetical protein UX28_C0004G0012 [Candidatus Pacebacteria bacterium GW2011_GWA1_46_10]KKW09960.1 MAG: hypothetical protein UY47_C0003G0048 [Parcubacteria group bacterium GW2011_GWB1_49_7]HCR81700.1 hypothetical protein [Candidatus Paceibacterota bacterium]
MTKKEVTVFRASPVLTRFTGIRAGWLGHIPPKKRRAYKRRKMLFQSLGKRFKRVQRQADSAAQKVIRFTLNTVIILTTVVSLAWLGPRVFYAVFPSDNQVQTEELSGNFQLQIDREKLEKEQRQRISELSKPPYNENLPEGDWLIIPRIGVRSVLQPTENYEDALKTGLWLAPNFGKPGDEDTPMIVAGHRFGFKWWWQDDYWKYHSFYLLPDLEPGDTVEVISAKRKYIYEIYAGEEGMEITDYTADLILYTCKYLDSPIRIFRYAKLLPPAGDTPLSVL